MNKELLNEWKQIAKQINKYDKKYAHGIPLISDISYDALKQRLEDIENIIGKQKNSPLNKIGEVEEETVPHENQMLSLDHGYESESISKFYKKIHNAIKSEPEMVLEHKIDGIAVSIRYKNNKLNYVLTRGDGFEGIDITKQSEYISGIPKTLSLDNFEVRGEVFMTFKDFEKTNGFKSPRNATAGIIRNKEMSFIASHNLQFIAHSFTNFSKFNKYIDMIHFLRNEGFKTSDYFISQDENKSIQIFKSINRDEISYPIDGMVLKINDLKICEELGNHRTAPRYAFAVKFAPKSSSTFIENIDMQIGKFGTITPVAEVKPIEIDGVEIKKVSIHNMLELKNKNYNIGDEIILARAGDVIPYILEKVSHKMEGINHKEGKEDKKNKDTINSDNISNLPEYCPCCETKLIWDSVTMKCTNGWKCKKQSLLRIEHFVSRKAMNISGLGSKNIEKLFEHQIIQKPNDIFKIIDLVLNNDGMIKKLLGTKVATNTYESIKANQNIALNKFIYALCIPNVGYGTAKTIADHCKTFDEFIKTFSDKEVEIKGLGPVIIESIKSFITEEMWIFDAYQNIQIN
ncbi:NAD-dependent DNA ligase LigA [Candidatus Cytomitobacter primus]|uniref:DNA ligase (NAD(+)) n=1 Tax=Candidatus Cytomitobacter primus TaxID=2066024 RepID=A0A5C0UEE0_9PROT|nr:NAD-dependent DNA ligase LigA [Candidatus Cytomitobacter primus]QEK38456.1 NAD-dependent DNA ligase LigA [Candidatus Cytomitobacter primus]